MFVLFLLCVLGQLQLLFLLLLLLAQQLMSVKACLYPLAGMAFSD